MLFGSGPHVSAPALDQIRHTYSMLLNGSENGTPAGFKPRFIWVRVMDSAEAGFQRGSNIFPLWSAVTWMTTTREMSGFVRSLRSCGGIYDDGRQMKNDCHWQRKVHNITFYFWSLVLTSIAPISNEKVSFSFFLIAAWEAAHSLKWFPHS